MWCLIINSHHVYIVCAIKLSDTRSDKLFETALPSNNLEFAQNTSNDLHFMDYTQNMYLASQEARK